MIAVIADDLTGAAELGGIGLRHGLRTEIRTIVPQHTTTHLLIIAADSRSKPEPAAIEEMTAITRQLKLLRPEWVYKKTDSVLRGHVTAELKAHLQILDLQSALLIPANPGLGRTIRDGHYYLNGKPVHHSAFSLDPEFPIYSSDIRDMLHEPVLLRKPEETLPDSGITIGEVETTADLQTWARHMPADTLAAGAAGFFTALLDQRFPSFPTINGHQSLNTPLLFISGTTFDRSRDSIRRQLQAGGPVRYMPENATDTWHDEVAGLLQKQNKAIVAIDPAQYNRSARELRNSMAEAIDNILKKTTPAEIIIEGGATAYAILQTLGWHTFIPEQELAPGLIRMRVAEAPQIFVTVKPGSYPWPDSISY
jgi:uncharacterized protein YgbK (DUF1537 family)